MTTVLVTKDNEMLSDSQMSSGSFILSYECKKIENINGYLVGVAGTWSYAVAFKEWFSELEETKEAVEQFPDCDITLPEIDDSGDEFYALVLSPDGTLTCFEDNNVSFEVEKPYGIGSGSEYAICALDAGADGYTAMTVAIKRDTKSGGEIQILKLGEEEADDEDEDN